MFEHLTNDFEKFRNKTIEVNDNLNHISEFCINNPDFPKMSESYKIKKMKEFLDNQEALNNLYRNRL